MSDDKKVNIMLVDDNDFDKQLFIRVLEKSHADYKVLTFDRAEEALQELDAHEQKFNLIVTDQNLPGMSGIEFSIEVFRRKFSLPIVMLTGAGSEHLAVAALKIGVEDYIVKDLNQGYVELLPIVIPKIIQKYEDRLVRSHAEEELKGYTRILEKNNEEKQAIVDQLKVANDTKNRFLGMASHDLKSPISIIVGFVNLLRDGIEGPVTENQLDCLDRMHSQCKFMQSLLDDLLSVSAIESGKLEFNPSIRNPVKVLQNVYDGLSVRAKDKGVDLTLEFDDNLPAFNFDDTRLTQVLSNLISNSIKFCACHDLIEFKAKNLEHDVEISVTDTGPGISDDELPKLFKAFQRLSNQATSGEKGTGLGLSISKEIVSMHHGSIQVESKLGEGTSFCLRFPVHPENGKVVLWVDDELALCKLAEKMVSTQLETKVFEVLIAKDGFQALEILKERHVDLVVSDILMPQMDGLELLETINNKYPLLNVVLMTAYQDRFDARESLARGAAGYFTKPFNIDEVKTLLDRVMSGFEETKTRITTD